MMERILRAGTRKPKLVVLGAILVTCAMFAGAARVSLSPQMKEFLPEHYPSVQVTREFENLFKGWMFEMVLVEADNVLSPEVMEALLELEEGVKEEFKRYVVWVESYTSYIRALAPGGPKPRAPTPPPEALGGLVTPDHRSCLMKIHINPQLPAQELEEFAGQLERWLEGFDERHDHLTLGVTGDLSIRLATADLMRKDNRTLAPLALALMVVVLFLTFRKLSESILPLVLVGMGTIWVLGLMGFLGIRFTMVHVAVIPLILGISIDYGIHMLNRYREERARGLSPELAANLSTKTTGKAVAITMLTTLIGFSSLLASDMSPIQTFGATISAGVLFVFLLAVFFLPAVLVLRDRGKPQGLGRGTSASMGLERLADWTVRRGKPITAIAVCATLVSLFLALGLSTAFSFEMFLPEELEPVDTLKKIENRFGGQDLLVVLVRGDPADPSCLKQMLELEGAVLEDPASRGLIVGHASVADQILELNQGRIPENRAEGLELLEVLRKRSPWRMEALVNPQGFAAIYFTCSAKTDEEMRRATQLVRAHIEELEPLGCGMRLNEAPAVGGEVAVVGDVLGGISSGAIRTTLLALLLCSAVLVLAFRSTVYGLIAILPVALTLSWELGTLRTLGVPLDMLTMSISALLVGIGVDFGVHVVHRFKEELGKRGPRKAPLIALGRVGASILPAASTTIGVFALLLASSMPALQRFGGLTALVVLYALVSALLILPCLLTFWARLKRG